MEHAAWRMGAWGLGRCLTPRLTRMSVSSTRSRLLPRSTVSCTLVCSGPATRGTCTPLRRPAAHSPQPTGQPPRLHQQAACSRRVVGARQHIGVHLVPPCASALRGGSGERPAGLVQSDLIRSDLIGSKRIESCLMYVILAEAHPHHHRMVSISRGTTWLSSASPELAFLLGGCAQRASCAGARGPIRKDRPRDRLERLGRGGTTRAARGSKGRGERVPRRALSCLASICCLWQPGCLRQVRRRQQQRRPPPCPYVRPQVVVCFRNQLMLKDGRLGQAARRRRTRYAACLLAIAQGFYHPTRPATINNYRATTKSPGPRARRCRSAAASFPLLQAPSAATSRHAHPATLHIYPPTCASQSQAVQHGTQQQDS